MKGKRSKSMVSIIFLAIITLVVVVFAILFTASGIFSKQKYLEPWEKSYSQKFDDPRIKLASVGLLASNGHNMQPWKIKLDADKNVFYLFADSERLSKEVDPVARQTMVTQGTFLEYMRVSGEKLGYKTNIAIFPDGEYDEKNLINSMKKTPVAKITLTKVEPKNSSLFDFIFLQDTNRAAYKSTQLNISQVNQLQAINADKDMNLKIFQDKQNIKRLGEYTMQGAKIESNIHSMNEESANIFRDNEYQKNKYRYGYSVEGQGTTGVMKHILQGAITLLPALTDEKASADLFVKSTQAAVDNTPAYAMIITKDNSRTQQVKSGMLYSRLILTSHSLGFVMQPVSQVLEEYPQMKVQYNKVHSEYAKEKGTIQMFVRMGKSTKEFPQSLRRDVMEIVR